jgi:hypothetical protein
MEKIHKPKGLISYQSLRLLSGRKFRFFSGRPLVYLFLLAVSLSVLGYRLAIRTPYSVEITRAIDTPYQLVRGQDQKEYLLNHFKVHLGNLGWEALYPQVTLSTVDIEDGVELILPPPAHSVTRPLESGESREFDVFLKIPRSRFVDPSREKSAYLVTQWSPGRISRSLMRWIGPSYDL